MKKRVVHKEVRYVAMGEATWNSLCRSGYGICEWSWNKVSCKNCLKLRKAQREG